MGFQFTLGVNTEVRTLGTMKAIRVDKPGDSSELKCEEIPVPEPGKNEVRRKAFATIE